MSIIFDLKNSENSWADSVNEALANDLPEYIGKHGEVGTEKWWKNYDSGLIAYSKALGRVSFVGKRQDFLNEEWDIVEIVQGTERIEYDRLGYWESDEIVVGAKVLVESFEISLQQKYGPMKFCFERLVQVIET
ncbi:hypothetical protein [Photobacterium alginatilyticum]|uniref:Uncharacterized protein n=1 Tax=Photobacterium alginatilyticum TaxID=1775171 RepID=A0ABW9YT02_9GAMM|nr:hypothetical protein [Photobacterium alginatilyticum]NBI56238.1 hypothetical protein [Photobacterium alginatilyticum]